MTKIEEIANAVGGYIMKHFVSPWGRNLVRYYRAKVVTPANGSVIVVQKPYDSTQLALPYTTAAAELTAGSQCIVLIMGDESNDVVFCDGKMSNLGGGGGSNITVTVEGNGVVITQGGE